MKIPTFLGNEISPLEEGRMVERGKKGNQSDSLLSGTNPGKEELLIGKQLHERIGEMFRSGRKKKEIALLLGVDIKTVREDHERGGLEALRTEDGPGRGSGSLEGVGHEALSGSGKQRPGSLPPSHPASAYHCSFTRTGCSMKPTTCPWEA